MKSGGKWRKVCNRGTCPTTKVLEIWSPREEGGTVDIFPEGFRVSFFLTLGELPSVTEGEGEVWGGRELEVPRKGVCELQA